MGRLVSSGKLLSCTSSRIVPCYLFAFASASLALISDGSDMFQILEHLLAVELETKAGMPRLSDRCSADVEFPIDVAIVGME